MLDLTKNAASAIRSIAARPELPDDTGLRMTSDTSTSGGFTVSVASAPEEGDHIVEKDGARVFLTPQAAAAVDGKVLDAHIGQDGNLKFSFSRE